MGVRAITAQSSRRLSQSGFSLVELMVVVAIIFLLATIAAPRVSRFIAKARQAEAQTNLSSIYTFNKNFFVEFQGYTTSFGAMGYRPEGQLRYNIGFSQGSQGPASFTTLKAPITYTNPASNAITNTLAICPVAAAPLAACMSLRGANAQPPPAINSSAIAPDFSTFTAQAVSMLITGAVNTCNGMDSWLIDQNKSLRNPCDGTQE